MKFKNIKEYNQSIFFVQCGSKCKLSPYYFVEELIEYNILSKKKYVLFTAESILDYCIYNSNMAICFRNQNNTFLYWDNGLDKPKNVNLNHNGINFSRFDFLITKNKLYLVLYCKRWYIYEFSNLVTIKHEWIRISNTGNRIMLADGYRTRIVDTVAVDLDYVFDKKTSHMNYIEPFIMTTYDQWVHSDYVVGFFHNNNTIIYNLKTNNSCISKSIQILYVLSDYLFVCDEYSKQMAIYDVSTLRLLCFTTCDLDILGTNNCLDILVTKNFEHYCINRNHCFEKINVGKNYVSDNRFVLGRIGTIMEIMLNIIDLPPEILCIELYRIVIDSCISSMFMKHNSSLS